IIGRGGPLASEEPLESVRPPDGAVAVFPVRKDGTEMNWEYKAEAFDKWWEKGYIRANGARNEPQKYIIQHLPNKARNEIAEGIAIADELREDGSVIAHYSKASSKTVTTQWNFKSHSAEHGGTGILKAMIHGRPFPFPKSVYAVEDVLSLFVAN